MKLYKSIIIIITLSSISLINAKLIMLIRHGEKISDASSNLAPRGKARANCLINIFGNNGTYATPQKIYAQSPTEKKQSTRPRDTVIPLSKELGLDVDLSYTSGQIKKLTKNIVNTFEKVVLVSWSNDNLPEIARKFGIENPPEWDSNVFDDIWMIYDNDLPSYYNINGMNKRDTYNGNEGYSMEIVKQNIEECINENIKNISQYPSSNVIDDSATSSGTNKISLIYFISVLCLFISIIIIY